MNMITAPNLNSAIACLNAIRYAAVLFSVIYPDHKIASLDNANHAGNTLIILINQRNEYQHDDTVHSINIRACFTIPNCAIQQARELKEAISQAFNQRADLHVVAESLTTLNLDYALYVMMRELSAKLESY